MNVTQEQINEIIKTFKWHEADIKIDPKSKSIVGYFYYTGRFHMQTEIQEGQSKMYMWLDDWTSPHFEYNNGQELLEYIEVIFETKRYHETQRALASEYYGEGEDY